MITFKPPQKLMFVNDNLPKIFLAGSIEMGVAEDWQTRVEKELQGIDGYILNPRRDDWDSSWKQEISNPKFYEQVSWELTALDMSNLILMYFDPTTKSPISLLELGLHAKDNKMIVVCPEKFWRKGNVDIVCERYGIEVYESLDDALPIVKKKLITHNPFYFLKTLSDTP